VSALNLPGCLTYIRNKAISDNARRQLQQISDVKTQIANTDAEKRLRDRPAKQHRPRRRAQPAEHREPSSVSGQQQIVQDYARKLSDQETQIAKLRDRETALDQQHTALQTQLNGLIEKLDF